jgi:polyisoprenoid-binding protein YceI
MSVNVATPEGISTGSWKIDTVHSQVGFAVKHMGVSTFRGRFDDYDGELVVEDGKPRLQGSVRTASVVVKDENLAGHLAAPDFFDSERFPEIRFVSTDVQVGEGGALEVEGELEIKGHRHPISARGSLTGPVDVGGVEKAGAELEAIIDRRDYGLDFNMTLPGGGLAVANDVKLEVTLEFAREA